MPVDLGDVCFATGGHMRAPGHRQLPSGCPDESSPDSFVCPSAPCPPLGTLSDTHTLTRTHAGWRAPASLLSELSFKPGQQVIHSVVAAFQVGRGHTARMWGGAHCAYVGRGWEGRVRRRSTSHHPLWPCKSAQTCSTLPPLPNHLLLLTRISPSLPLPSPTPPDPHASSHAGHRHPLPCLAPRPHLFPRRPQHSAHSAHAAHRRRHRRGGAHGAGGEGRPCHICPKGAPHGQHAGAEVCRCGGGGMGGWVGGWGAWFSFL